MWLMTSIFVAVHGTFVVVAFAATIVNFFSLLFISTVHIAQAIMTTAFLGELKY